jgi:hypothetical protein
MVPNSFLILLFSIIIIFPFTIAQTLDDYYNGEPKKNNNENELEDNDCLCDTNPLECNFQCCCDENCPNEAIEDWENHSKCINEQNTPKLSDDKCIDRNLFAWFYNSSKEYPKRGLRLETQTEDIPKKSGSINNLCFSIDNSKSKDIITLDELEKYGYKNIDKLYDDIFNDYIEPYFIKNNIENSDSETGTVKTLRRTSTDDGTETNTEGIKIVNENENNKDYFVKNGYFSLFSGTNCENINIVEKWSRKNYSCLMKSGQTFNYQYFDNIKINGLSCNKTDGRYYIDDDGLLKKGISPQTNLIVLQVEFILNINSSNSDIDNCKINIVEYANNTNTNTFTFKNSVIFTNNSNMPYLYSGNIGYLNDYPLKIYFQDKVYNDFYIIGKKSNGDCRIDNDTLNYLYFSDKPLLFNEDYTYSCNLMQNISLKDTTIYKKIMNIKGIAKYGSSDYNNVVGNEDWIKIDPKKNFNNSIENEKNKTFNIKMKITFKTDKQKGFYSHRYINDVSITVDKEECKNKKCNIKLEIKYYGDDETNESKYTKIPDRPFFIPNIPDDILDPFINPDVDK